MASVLAPAAATEMPAPSISEIRARVPAPAGVSGIARSMCVRRPTTPSTSCALETSMRRTSESPVRVSSSAGCSTPTTGRSQARPFTSTGSVSPGATPARAAVGFESTMPPRVVMKRPTSTPTDSCAAKPPLTPATNGRKGPSEKGSTPRTRRACPGRSGEEAYPSTTGAEARTPSSARSRGRSVSSTSPVSLVIRCVARPDTVSAETRKPARALCVARSIARTTATPSATPTTESTSCARWRPR